MNMIEAANTQRLKTLVGTILTLVAVWVLAAMFAIALIASDEAQRVFATFLALALLGFATRTRRYQPPR
jgi:hypothetical protein